MNLIERAIHKMVRNKALNEYNGNSTWEVPTFGVPKKNDGVRNVSDFRKLNEAIKRNPWSMPTIQDILQQCRGITYATALDMIISYYVMKVREDMRKYLVIILPWSKYVYNKMPMGLKIPADFFQRELSMIFKICHTSQCT